MDRCSLLKLNQPQLQYPGKATVHTIANLDLHLRIPFGDVLHTANDLGHPRTGGIFSLSKLLVKSFEQQKKPLLWRAG